MSLYAIIGGSGLNKFDSFQITHRQIVITPFGSLSAPLVFGKIADQKIVFLARHGSGHIIPPHQINYRANIWALKEAGVTNVLAFASVGGISEAMAPGVICVPDQIIDYTHGRHHTFYDQFDSGIQHTDFTQPFCSELRQKILNACQKSALDAVDGGVYGTTQGPRLETAAEIKRMAKDGCDLVGMTAMPEAILAAECGLCYASFTMVVNWAAGLQGNQKLNMEDINIELKKAKKNAGLVLQNFEF